MGTKSNPGQYDCHTKAEPDEPLFTLLARDPTASHLVDAWAALRTGDYGEALRCLARADDAWQEVCPRTYPLAAPEKVIEARSCAEQMRAWKKSKDKESQ